MTSLWVREIRRHRIVRSETAPLADDASLLDVLGALCARMDVPRPLFLAKHAREWAQFGQTFFSPEHFVESVSFDRLEIERIDPDAKKARSSDPRNG